MEFSKFLHQLDLPARVIEEVEKRREYVQQYAHILPGLTKRETAEKTYKEMDKLMAGDADHMGMLACQLWTAFGLRQRWLEMGISDRIFLDTMGCYRRFLGEALKKTGKIEFDRGWWTYRQLSSTLFRVGQLEFEMMAQPKIISVHIPSDSRLEPELVDASMAQAREFFGKVFPEYAHSPIVCHSWLLSPMLGQLLSETSRILSFQRRFLILKTEPDAMDCLEWLFMAPENVDLHTLPENTSLQRSVKKTLLNGGKIGCALGVIQDAFCPPMEVVAALYSQYLS